MRIKDRMEVGQLWQSEVGNVYDITGLGEDGFFSRPTLGLMRGIEKSRSYSSIRSAWALVYSADGMDVRPEG